MSMEEQIEQLDELQKLAIQEEEQLSLFAEGGGLVSLVEQLGKELQLKSRIQVEVLNEGTPSAGHIPVKAHRSDAGFDLYATEDVVFNQGEVTKHPLNIKLHLPPGTYAHIKGKSGLGSQGLCLLAEIIDEGYRGVPHVVATNTTFKQLRVKKGEKIAQMIMHPYSDTYFLEQVDKVDEETDRGAGGFGSTGKG